MWKLTNTTLETKDGRCGGDESDSPSGNSTSRHSWVTTVPGICYETHRAVFEGLVVAEKLNLENGLELEGHSVPSSLKAFVGSLERQGHLSATRWCSVKEWRRSLRGGRSGLSLPWIERRD